LYLAFVPAVVWAQPAAATSDGDIVTANAAQSAGARPADQTSASAPRVREDPFERTNRSFFKVQSAADRAVFRPVALGYKHVVPRFLRSAIRNLLHEFRLPIVFLNDVLQLKPRAAVKTLERFVINTTVGIGGIVDVAKKAHLPYRRNGFGNTLGRYGVKPGPYLYLPLIGPTTVRDLFGGGVDGVIPPTTIGFPYARLDYRLSTAVTATLDVRAESDDNMHALLDSAADPYATLRSVYLQDRAAEIDLISGKKATSDTFVDPLADPAAPAVPPVAPAPPTPPNSSEQPSTSAKP
jgi:phospholipid-binding lipoprotein MlaA